MRIVHRWVVASFLVAILGAGSAAAAEREPGPKDREKGAVKSVIAAILRHLGLNSGLSIPPGAPEPPPPNP
jgi:hypothetical protein